MAQQSMENNRKLDKIPIIDMENLYNIPFNRQDERIQNIAKILRNSLHEYGFAYLANHGIPEKIVERAFIESRHFFELPRELKLKCAKKEDILKNFHGYTVPGQELLNEKSVFELRENFDVAHQSRFYPIDQVPNFQVAMETLEEALIDFDIKLFKILAMSLELDDINYFCDAMKSLKDKTKSSATHLGSNFYAAIPPGQDESMVGLTRCAEHSDWDFMTLLFQDDIGGLEIKRADNKWIQSEPIPNTIVLNVGDLLELFTGGYFPATPHRVLIPEAEVRKRSPRQSIGFFVFPDDDVFVKPITSQFIPVSNEFKGKFAKEHFINKAGKAYGINTN